MMSDFFDKGYSITKNILTEEECISLFKQILYDWQTGDSFSNIHSSDFRIHCPVQITDLTKTIVQRVVETHKDILKDFFDDVDPWLVELSSICVFPNAESQHLHRDQSDPDGKLVTFFINLLDVEDNIGPLLIGNTPMSLPQGSCVMMNSLTEHAGDSNSTHSNVRPVFYFSIGDPDLVGPTYSIASIYKKKVRFTFK